MDDYKIMNDLALHIAPNVEQQSTVEDKGWEEKIKDIVFTRHQSGAEAGNAAYEAIAIIKSELQLAEQKARGEINKEWLSLNLCNDNKENWDSELTKFGLYMQGLSTK